MNTLVKMERHSNIELLRILCIIGVITLHFCNSTPNALDLTAGLSKWIMSLIYSFAIVAVNVFLIISGYFSIDNKQVKVLKIVDLLIMVVAYHLLFFVISSIQKHSFSVKEFVWAFIPSGYFILIYLTVYVLSPWINRAVYGLTKPQFQTLLFLMTFLFVFWNFTFNLLGNITGKNLTDVFTIAQFTTDRGFTIVIFVLMYLWGGYIMRYGLFGNNKSLCILIVLCCVIATSTIRLFFPKLDAVLYYDSIFVVAQSLATFTLFTQLHFHSYLINKIAKYTFGIYLGHSLGLNIVGEILSENDVFSMNLMYVLIATFIGVLLVYVISLIIDYCRSLIWLPITKLYSKISLYNKTIRL